MVGSCFQNRNYDCYKLPENEIINRIDYAIMHKSDGKYDEDHPWGRLVGKWEVQELTEMFSGEPDHYYVNVRIGLGRKKTNTVHLFSD